MNIHDLFEWIRLDGRFSFERYFPYGITNPPEHLLNCQAALDTYMRELEELAIDNWLASECFCEKSIAYADHKIFDVWAIGYQWKIVVQYSYSVYKGDNFRVAIPYNADERPGNKVKYILFNTRRKPYRNHMMVFAAR